MQAPQHDMRQHPEWVENYGRIDLDMDTHLDLAA
jgi:pterin-4a-carbinolamine dehydratase